MSILRRRLEHVRKQVRMTRVMEHFGHRYRTWGNMLCPFHEEQNPSARLYSEQDTFWCWVCSPDHGVDIVEYVILELGLEADVDPGYAMEPKKRHSLATYRSLEYIETEFDCAFEAQPWEQRMEEALRPFRAIQDPEKYWRHSLTQLLRIMALSSSGSKWEVYADHMETLTPLRNHPIEEQRSFWSSFRSELASLSA